MSFDCKQFRDLIGRVLHLNSNPSRKLHLGAAVNLLLGTAAQESAFGTYLRQLGGGPALGAFQMEEATFEWLRGKYGVELYLHGNEFEELEWNLQLAILLARLRYWVVPEPLPSAYDIPGMARYYKKYFNTATGKGTAEEFEENYRRYVKA